MVFLRKFMVFRCFSDLKRTCLHGFGLAFGSQALELSLGFTLCWAMSIATLALISQLLPLGCFSGPNRWQTMLKTKA